MCLAPRVDGRARQLTSCGRALAPARRACDARGMRRIPGIIVVLAWGCGSDGSPPGDEANETGTSAPADSSGNGTTAVTSAPGEESSPGTSSADETGAPTGPTFAEDVAPI